MPNKELSYVNYNGETYEINAVKVNNHTVQSDVPADYNWNKTRVELSNINANGNNIATIALDGTETILKAPAYTATSPISINSSTLAISHANSGVSANTYGTLSNSDIAPGSGGTFIIPAFTVDATGHITGAGAHTVIMPTVEVAADLTSGTKIATVSVDGTDEDIYIPSYPTIESLGLSKALKFIGFSTTQIADGQSTTPTISGLSSYTPTVGDVVIDGSDATASSQWEYVYTSANKWERLGGDSSYVISGTEYDVTNGGTNANSAVTISPQTTAIYSMTSAGSVEDGSQAELSMSVINEKLIYSWMPNTPTSVTLPGRSNAIDAWTGYNTGVANTYAAAQVFTPTTKTITVD